MDRTIASTNKNDTIMKQPALGQKILALRKQKGLTQEELVAQCNLNVRTIQRIEAGEVTPRSYTIKTILDVLGFDLDKISTQEDTWDTDKTGINSIHLKIAWICGVVYFLLGFLEFAADYSRYFEGDMLMANAPYIILKIGVLATYIYFIWGFIITGTLFKQYLLKIASYLLIGINLLFYSYDIISLFTATIYTEQVITTNYVITTHSIFYGIAAFLFGFALLRLVKPIGKLATISGGLMIACAVFFIIVFLGFLGYIFSIPAIVLQIILLFKVETLLVEKQKEIA